MKLHDEFYYPDDDTQCSAVLPTHVLDIDKVLPHVKVRKSCIQAGGNVGVFAKRLAREFEFVYTFEPDPDNFACLAKNVEEKNVFKFQAALGERAGNCTLGREPNNCGANYILPNGPMPVLAIDSLKIEGVGLIYLDIEGWEYLALAGAIRTIVEFKPTIVIEDKGLSNRYGIARGVCEKMLSAYGYKVQDRLNDDKDVILA